MKIQIDEQDHWRLFALNQQLRAQQAEEQLLQWQFVQLQQQRRLIQEQWQKILYAVGEKLGAKGDPKKWTITFGSTPTESVFESEDNNGRD